MPTLTQTQIDWLTELTRRIQKTMDEVWYAYETAIMSDAKTDVSLLEDYVRENQVLPAALTAELMSFFGAATPAIIHSSNGTCQQRAGRASYLLAQAEKRIQEVLAHE